MSGSVLCVIVYFMVSSVGLKRERDFMLPQKYFSECFLSAFVAIIFCFGFRNILRQNNFSGEIHWEEFYCKILSMLCRGGGGQMVSMLTFNSDGPSLNHAEVYSENLFVTNEKGASNGPFLISQCSKIAVFWKLALWQKSDKYWKSSQIKESIVRTRSCSTIVSKII